MQEVATLGQEEVGVGMGLLQVDMELPLQATELPLQATELPLRATGLPQVVPLGTEQPLEGCLQDTGRPQGEEALGTRPHVTVMAVGEEGQLPLMMPLSMFTNNSRPPLQVETFQQIWRNGR